MTIEELFLLSTSSVAPNEHLLLDLEIGSEALAERVRLEAGIDIAGFVVSIDNYGIKHTFYRHNDPVSENRQGQRAVGKNDFDLIQLIINEADVIIYDPRQKGPKSKILETLVFEKQVGDYYYVLKEIRRVTKKGKVNRLVFQTMYITKKRRTF